MKRHTKLVISLCLIASLLVTSGFYTDTARAATIKLNKAKVSIKKGKTYTLKMTGTKSKVKWTTSKSKVATVSTTGKVTARAYGVAKIIATVKGKKYTCTVTVPDPKVDIYTDKIVVIKGATQKLWVTGTKNKVTWKSANTKIATVTQKGVVKGKGFGTTKVTAKVNGITYSCTVKVPTINLKYVREEATKKLKAKGFVYLPEEMDKALEQGIINQETYDKYYPNDGAGWAKWPCRVGSNVSNERLIKEIVEHYVADKTLIEQYQGKMKYYYFYIDEKVEIWSGEYVFKLYYSFEF